IIIANPAAWTLFGVAVGASFEQAGQSFDRFYPDGVTPLEKTVLMRTIDGEVIDNVELIAQPKGSMRKYHLVANGRPLRNEAGEIQGAVMVYHDVTQNRKTQEALRESEQMARAIIDTALDAFVQIDRTGAITEWSPHAETMFGFL